MTKTESLHIKKVINKTGKAINQYSLIKKDDTIMVAVSGGKDSLSLMEILSTRRKFLPIHYHLHAVHIITEDVPYQINVDWLKKFCNDLNITLHIVKTKANIATSTDKKPCFVCSWNRRKELFKLTSELGIKKLALGHHLDDAIETLIMNMAQHANISSIPPKLEMFDHQLEVIRPLILLTNAEIKEYARLLNFESLKKDCPFEDHTNRQKARELIEQMTTINPKARFNLFHSMSKINMEYLP